MDIRKFFSPTNTKKDVKHTKITNKECTNDNGKSKKRRLVIESDSDEEPIPIKKCTSSKNVISKLSPVKINGRVTSPKQKLNLQKLKKFRKEEKSLKPVSSNNFFKSPPNNKLNIKTEPVEEIDVEIESFDFEKTLQQLDKKHKTLKTSRSENILKTDCKSQIDEEIFIDSMFRINGTQIKLKQFPFGCIHELEQTSQNEKNKPSFVALPVKVEKEKNCKNTTESEGNGKFKKTPTKEKKAVLDKASAKVENNTEKKVNVISKKTPTKEKKAVLDKASAKVENNTEKKANGVISKKTPTKTNQSQDAKTDGTPENKRNSANYFNYLHRDGPQSLGSKEVPDGAENCLEGLTFLLTGILESFERDEMKDILTKYGAKVMATLSKNTQYMVVGRDAGPAKLEKAEKLGTKLLTEDEMLDMIRTRPGKKSSPKSVKPVKKGRKINEAIDEDIKPILPNHAIKKEPVENVKLQPVTDDSGLMWVDKFKPKSLRQVIGQHGDRSCANKLLPWLRNWWHNNGTGKKPFAKKWNAKEDGSIFKAALLSGAPGIGKTTTAQLVCEELNFQYIELNASDTRSKKSLQTEIAELLQNQKITASLKGGQLLQKHVIIFDEVDGMSGNEDRGGTQELIALIKHSKIPVICICNDRQHPKIRSLANYCFDLRFLKPRVEQIKAAMMTLLHKEKLKVQPETLHEIIVATNQDMRQVLHHLSFLSSKDIASSNNSKTATKDFKLGPFDVLKKVFVTDGASATINEKASLFFHDYSLGPLFVQENYPGVKPMSVKSDIHKHLTLLSETADSISYADTIDRTIRSQNNWSLLPVAAIFASVIPGEYMRGYFTQTMNFPTWLGKHSSKNRMDRVLQQVHMHTRLHVSANKTELGLDYMSQLKHNLTSPLIERGSEGVSTVVDVMQNYFLLREDLDSIVELAHWPNQKDPMLSIEPKTKAALTRTLNKECQRNPYATVSVKKGKKRSADTSFDDALGEDEIDEYESDAEADDVNVDAMVKQNKVSKISSDSDGTTSKGRGKGKSSTSSRGRGRGKKSS